MSERAKICLNGFHFTFTYYISLSKGIIESENLIFFYSCWRYLILLIVLDKKYFCNKDFWFSVTFGDWGSRGPWVLTNDITYKYIYDAFLTIYLFILLLLVFHFLVPQRS